MTPQLQEWIQLVKDRLHETEMPRGELAKACGVANSTISELIKYGKGSDELKGKVSKTLGIEKSWTARKQDGC